MSEIFSEQLTAVATLALAVLALVAGVLAGLALRRQTQEVGLFLEQNKRDADERRRAQAARIFLTAPPDEGRLVSPFAYNASEFPVYDAQIQYYEASGKLFDPEYLGMIMPGQSAASAHKSPADEALSNTAILFRDAAGVGWIRMPDGKLWEQDFRPGRDSYRIWSQFRGMELISQALRKSRDSSDP